MIIYAENQKKKKKDKNPSGTISDYSKVNIQSQLLSYVQSMNKQNLKLKTQFHLH